MQFEDVCPPLGEPSDVALEIADPTERARVLGQLVRSAYTFIRREDDHFHEGSYTPDTRDNAETAGNSSYRPCLTRPAPRRAALYWNSQARRISRTFRIVCGCSAEAARGSGAEFAPFDPKALAAMESRHEAPPHDRDGLFTVMMDRLDDLAHDVAHHDFTDRRTLRTITEEAEMQRTLSWRISASANGAFVVTREDEVADQKRTDIRLSAVKGDQKAVAELKIADARWTLRDLERALRDQLVGQYLRHATCKAGCLLNL